MSDYHPSEVYACVGCGLQAAAGTFPRGPEHVCAACEAEGRQPLMTSAWAVKEPPPREQPPEEPPRRKRGRKPKDTADLRAQRPERPPGESWRVEVGRMGGLATAERAGREHFRAIGRLGGKALAEKRGPEFFREIGRKGGRPRHGAESEPGAASPAGDMTEQGAASDTLDWLVSPISLDACADSLGVPVARLEKAAKDGELRAVKRGEHWFTDRGVWAEFKARQLGGRENR